MADNPFSKKPMMHYAFNWLRRWKAQTTTGMLYREIFHSLRVHSCPDHGGLIVIVGEAIIANQSS